MSEPARVLSPAPGVFVAPSASLPLVSVTVAQLSGASVDPDGLDGLSRLTGRLMRRTGGGLDTEEIDTRIDSLGASLGLEAGHSSVAFHGTCIERSLDAFGDLLKDILTKPSLSEAELSRLKRETEAELIEVRDHDRSLARRWFRKTLFAGHPYSRSVSGTIASTRAIERQHVVGAYESGFGASNRAFAFAGDVDEERAMAIAERISIAAPGAPSPAADLSDPSVRSGRHLLIVDKPERTQTQILIGGLGSHPHDDDHTALYVGNTIFGGTFTARMTREIRSKRGWSYGAYSNLPYDRRRRSFSMWTFPKAEDAAPCIALELKLLEQWRDRGVTERELTWAKRYLVRSHAFAVDTAAKRVAHTLDERVYGLPEGYHARYVDRVRAVTVDQVNAAIRRRISVDDLLVTVVGTASDVATPIEQAVDRLASTTTVAYDDDV